MGHKLTSSSLGGYPKGRTFGCVVGERDASGREDFLAYHRSAIDLQGPVVRQVEKLAADIQIFIVSGVIERDGGTLYCSVIWVDHERGLLDKRRKVSAIQMETDLSSLTSSFAAHANGIRTAHLGPRDS